MNHESIHNKSRVHTTTDPSSLLRLLRLDNLLHDLGLFDEECTEDATQGMRIEYDGGGKSRAHRCLTQSPHREPPYARETDF
jgi:hypothetical protein